MPQPAFMQQQHWGALLLIIPLIIMLPFRGYSHPGKGDRVLRIVDSIRKRGAGPGRRAQASPGGRGRGKEREREKERERQAAAE